MRLSQRIAAGGLALVMASGLMVASPAPARASEEGRRNTAIALAVAAGAILLSQSGRHRDRCDDDYRYSRRYDRNDRDCDRYDRYDRSGRYDRYDRGDRYDRRYDRTYTRYDRYDRYDDCRRR